MNAAMFSRFHDALLDPSTPLPAALAVNPQNPQRFAVHRRTCRNGLINALRSAYPAIETAVGTAFFDALAAEFVRQTPPRSPVLQEYSPHLPAFLEHFPPLSGWPWLGDVARIDWARREAYHEEDAEPLTAGQLQAWRPQALLAATLCLHPSLRTLVSSHPAWSLWCCQQQSREVPSAEAWRAECTQVWRIDVHVCQRVIGAGEALLRQHLAHRRSLGDALQAALCSDPDFEAAAALATLVSDGLVVAVIR